jgi:hypothetical protein
MKFSVYFLVVVCGLWLGLALIVLSSEPNALHTCYAIFAAILFGISCYRLIRFRKPHTK